MERIRCAFSAALLWTACTRAEVCLKLQQQKRGQAHRSALSKMWHKAPPNTS